MSTASRAMSKGRAPRGAQEESDKHKTCSDCGDDFVWTAGEQKFYRERGLGNEPRRCQQCRGKRKRELAAKEARSKERVEVRVTCAQCGEQTTVPFYPSLNKPVYCRSCFLERNGAGVKS